MLLLPRPTPEESVSPFRFTLIRANDTLAETRRRRAREEQKLSTIRESSMSPELMGSTAKRNSSRRRAAQRGVQGEASDNLLWSSFHSVRRKARGSCPARRGRLRGEINPFCSQAPQELRKSNRDRGDTFSLAVAGCCHSLLHRPRSQLCRLLSGMLQHVEARGLLPADLSSICVTPSVLAAASG